MRKNIDINNPGNITRKQEKTLMEAFENYDSDAPVITAPKRDHLGGKVVKGVSCPHQWTPAPAQDDVSKWFQVVFEEDCDPGHYCKRCGAVALFSTEPNYMGVEKTQLWALDTTTRFFGKVPKNKGHKNAKA